MKPGVKAQMHSQAGKSTEYKYHLNLLNDGEKDPVELNFENRIKAWQPCANDNLAEKEKKEEETQEIFISSAFPKQKVTEAKERELQSWLENYVCEVVLRKNIIDKPRIKARLVARGYEEKDTVRSDSPTCYKESVRILLAIFASKFWKLHSLIIKTAFLKGRVMESDVYLRPPSEANCKG